MRLVIDTNIIISSLISNSIRRSILMDSGFELMAPEYTFTEIMNHANLIKKMLTSFAFSKPTGKYILSYTLKKSQN